MSSETVATPSLSAYTV